MMVYVDHTLVKELNEKDEKKLKKSTIHHHINIYTCDEICENRSSTHIHCYSINFYGTLPSVYFACSTLC